MTKRRPPRARPASRVRGWTGRVVLWCGLVSSAAACTRKAPGPEECRSLAARALGVRSSTDLELRSVRERYLMLTRECLTTPFDRAFVQCLDDGRQFRSCHAQFQVRRRASRELAR